MSKPKEEVPAWVPRVNQVISTWREEHGASQNAAERALGWQSSGRLASFLKGARPNPQIRTMMDIAELTGASLDYLLLGKLPMYRDRETVRVANLDEALHFGAAVWHPDTTEIARWLATNWPGDDIPLGNWLKFITSYDDLQKATGRRTELEDSDVHAISDHDGAANTN